MRLKFYFCLLIFIIFTACNFNPEKKTISVEKIDKLRKGENWEEILNSEVSDVPAFLNFVYSKDCNAIFAPITQSGDTGKFFLKLSLTNWKMKDFDLYGTPGQCPECLLLPPCSVSLCDSMIAVGMVGKGYNFYNCEGEFLFQFLSAGCPGGECFFYEDKLISFPYNTSMISDYAVYVFSLQTKKLEPKHIKKEEFFQRLGFNPQEKIETKGGKISFSRRISMGFDYAKIGDKVIMLPQANPKGTQEFYIVSLEDFSIKKISLSKYCKYLNKHFPKNHFEPFSTITTKGNNVIVARRLILFEEGEIEEIKKKFGFLLLLEFNLDGDLINIYVPPKGIFVSNCNRIAPIDIQSLGNDEYLLNEFQFYKKDGKDRAIKHLIKFTARKLSEEEKRWVVERL